MQVPNNACSFFVCELVFVCVSCLRNNPYFPELCIHFRLITGCISGMLPVALALLPFLGATNPPGDLLTAPRPRQRMEIPVSKLEAEYQNLKAGRVLQHATATYVTYWYLLFR